MASEAIRLAKIQREQALAQEVFTTLRSPAYSLLAMFVIIEALQQIRLENGEYFMSRAGTVLETGAVATALLQSPAVSEGTKSLMSGLGSLLPLLVAAPK